MACFQNFLIIRIVEHYSTKLIVTLHDNFFDTGAIRFQIGSRVTASILNFQGQFRVITICHDHVNATPITRLVYEAHDWIIVG